MRQRSSTVSYSAFDQATADPPNPDSPALLATTIDPVLAEVRNLASSWKGFGQALRYPANSAHRVNRCGDGWRNRPDDKPLLATTWAI